MSWELVIVDIHSPTFVGFGCNHLNQKYLIFIVRYSLLIVIFGVKPNKERITVTSYHLYFECKYPVKSGI